MFNSLQQKPESPFCDTQSGWTLVEMMVATVVGVFVMGAVLATFIYVVKSFVILGNYYDLDKDSRHTLDVLSHDIRGFDSATSIASSGLNMTDTSGNVIIYNWDGSNFVRTYNGEAQVMLKNCDFFNMSFYQRNVSNNFTFFTTSDKNQIKLVDVQWHCWRPVLGSKLTTESVQTAKIVARNY